MPVPTHYIAISTIACSSACKLSLPACTISRYTTLCTSTLHYFNTCFCYLSKRHKLGWELTIGLPLPSPLLEAMVAQALDWLIASIPCFDNVHAECGTLLHQMWGVMPLVIWIYKIVLHGPHHSMVHYTTIRSTERIVSSVSSSFHRSVRRWLSVVNTFHAVLLPWADIYETVSQPFIPWNGRSVSKSGSQSDNFCLISCTGI